MPKARRPLNPSSVIALLALAVLTLVLSIPSHGFAAPDPGRDDQYTAAELCQNTCNRDHDICMDSPAASPDTFDAPRGVVGMSAVCDREMRECLRNCATARPVRGSQPATSTP